jgi:hypothetical protein
MVSEHLMESYSAWFIQPGDLALKFGFNSGKHILGQFAHKISLG